jgi:hypothetical protein
VLVGVESNAGRRVSVVVGVNTCMVEVNVGKNVMVGDAVAEGTSVALGLAVAVGVNVGVPDIVGVGVWVPVGVGVKVPVCVAVRVTVGLGVPGARVGVIEGVLEGVTVNNVGVNVTIAGGVCTPWLRSGARRNNTTPVQ